MSHALDNDHKTFHLVYYFGDGTSITSREQNFHDIVLSNIVRIDLMGKKAPAEASITKADLPSAFQEFIVFRSVESRMERGGMTTIHSCTVGWTDGTTEHMREFRIPTGALMSESTAERNFAKAPSHFHPDSAGRGIS